jgi:hypothetical protein
MGKRPDVIYDEIRLTRQQISTRVEEMRTRGQDDAQEVKDRVADVFQGAGLREQVEQQPFVALLGALGVGVALGMASESVNLRAIAGGKGEQQKPFGGRSGGRGDGLFASLTAGLSGAAVEEGRQLLHEWIGNLRPAENGNRSASWDEKTSAR